MGRGQQVNFLWETGGLANRNSFEVHFTEPWLDKRHTSLSLSLFDKAVYRFTQRIGSFDPGSSVTDSDYYYETHRGGQITVSRPFSDTYRGFVGLRHDNVSVPNLTLEDIDRRILQNGALSGINFRLTHNTRDFDLEPATGGYETYTMDLGRADLKPVGEPEPGEEETGVFGILNYTRYGVDARRYFSPQGRRVNPKDRRTVFAFRLMSGSSGGTLPFSEQWFMGGAESLRGYQEDRFWGSNMFLFSGEYRHPLAQSLTGVVFADLGDAWGGPYKDVQLLGFEQHSNFSPSLGFGIGLRVITPIGPIRIDQGFGREGARTHFSIGHVF
jgi:outer membrane protein insertion porin family